MNMKRKRLVPMVFALLAALAFSILSPAQVRESLAPGGPGRDAQWPSAGKEAVGTSNTRESKVWFTLRGGVMDEVYYPTVDVANTQTLSFIVTGCGEGSPSGARVAAHRLELTDPQSLSFRQTSETDTYTLRKTYTTDPERPVVLIDVEFDGRCRALQRLYVYHDPSLGNSGMHDTAWTEDGALLASDGDKASALVASGGFDEASNGFAGTSDGLAELGRQGILGKRYTRAADGNVVQIGEVGNRTTLALGFGKDAAEALRNARASLAKGFNKARAEYKQGWHDYLKTLRRVEPRYQAQYDMAAMVLKAHEDKTYRGAMIASLSVPW